MKIDIIRIGNSQGIVIPKPVLNQCNLSDKVEMEVKNNKIIISNAKSPRSGWEKAFKSMNALGDDKLLLDDAYISEWDEKEW